MQRILAIIGALALLSSSAASADGWTPVAKPAPFSASTALLLTDGRVMLQDASAKDWWVLTPDATGDYAKGSWTAIASLPIIAGVQYAPLYYASAVLKDGKVLIMGGEYNNNVSTFSNEGALYDPQANIWTAIKAPVDAGVPWKYVGDASSVVLTDGTLMMANIVNKESALFDEATLGWTVQPNPTKADKNDEEGWTLLPDGSVLTVDVNNLADPTHSERFYDGAWQSAGETKAQIDDTTQREIGPAVLRPNGTVIAFGATGHNAVYVPSKHPTATGTWQAAPDFPTYDGQQLDVADGPAAPLPDGHVLVAASPGTYETPIEFFEAGDEKTFTPRPGTPNAPDDSSYYGRMLVLPTGQILFTDFSSDVELYTSTGKPDPAWLPTITASPPVITNGTTHTIKGTQLNGLTQGAAYGDDAQMATNFPLVRILGAGGTVTYCRTWNFSTMAVATGSRTVSTDFTCKGLHAGTAMLEVVANGLASAPAPVTIR